MKNLFCILPVTVASLYLLALSLWAGENLPPLRVGVAPVTPPMIFKEGGKIVGVEADFAHALGKALGREIKFVELDWNNLIDALIGDKIDIIMSSMSVTRARQFRIAFSEPYLRTGQMMLSRGGDKDRLVIFDRSLADRTIGLRKGTTGDLVAQQEFPRAKRKYFRSDDEGAKALSKGRIDLFIDDSTMVWYLAGVYEAEGLVVVPLVLSEEVLAWGMRRSDTALQESVNAFLRKGKDSGAMNQVLHRWIPKLQ